MSKFLEWLGVRAMTNREVLMDDLDRLDDATFVRVIVNDDLSELLDGIRCRECRQCHGGTCPQTLGGRDDNCLYTLEDWLAQPCKHEHLIDGKEQNQ